MAGYVLEALGLVLGSTLVVAAVCKWFDSHGLQGVLHASLPLSEESSTRIARAVIAAEGFFGTVCLLAMGTEWGLYLGISGVAVLMALFNAWIASVILRHKALTCACFGRLSSTVTWRTFLRNSTLGAAAAAMLVAQARGSGPRVTALDPADQFFFGLSVLAVSISLAAFWNVQPSLATTKEVRRHLEEVEGV